MEIQYSLYNKQRTILRIPCKLLVSLVINLLNKHQFDLMWIIRNFFKLLFVAKKNFSFLANPEIYFPSYV